ncbi:MAG: helix-turn-helix domain-containing protein [Pirellulaceae bacterium]|nr:helix-turn-helix domain-containing protein [Pirellulaceae bacterium]
MVAEVSDRSLLTREQAAEYLGIKPQTLSVWASTGRYSLPMVRVGRCVRYRVADLERFIESRTVSHTGESS